MTLTSSKPGTRRAHALSALLPWAVAIVFLLTMPVVFPSNSAITIMNQMAITIVFALSYNMLLGQAGMLSFGHAIYMGFGGFMCIHVMNFVQAENLPVPLPVLPLFAGLFSLGMATLIGSFSTRKSGVVFAMISLGIVELVASCSLIIYSFFRGGGVGGDRTLGMPFFGIEFLYQIEVYYLISVWLALSVALMYGFSRTPIGRMANAVRENPERAEYLGYSTHWVRLYSFCAAGFFAGVAGGLFAINYELATVENFSLQTSGTILMIAFLGGVGVFFGPILGAVLFTMLQTVLSLETDLWQLYVAALFMATVMYFPGGLGGVVMMHVPVIRFGTFGMLVKPYAKTLIPAAFAILGLSALVEMLFYTRHSAVGAHDMTLFWMTFNSHSPLPWLIAAGITAGGLLLARRNAPELASAWHDAHHQTPWVRVQR
ncbi:branched-chain amino acid ABC transporter permease [Phaeobacter marinintestinus]|uniref:branched-chain amino acid ABC transporter permease n=1 Tax=Falsiphaeobacter marinintestinus TaxID=1492905 RepID=UPI0011B6453A|nr:branched-chain amino acid ABC transporter permease [Phaeobacter marinintestinus]